MEGSDANGYCRRTSLEALSEALGRAEIRGAAASLGVGHRHQPSVRVARESAQVRRRLLPYALRGAGGRAEGRDGVRPVVPRHPSPRRPPPPPNPPPPYPSP